jgi:L-serine deaminase
VLISALGGEILSDGNGLWPCTRPSGQVVVRVKARSALITLPSASWTAFAVHAGNASGHDVVSDIVPGATAVQPTPQSIHLGRSSHSAQAPRLAY